MIIMSPLFPCHGVALLQWSIGRCWFPSQIFAEKLNVESFALLPITSPKKRALAAKESVMTIVVI